MVLGSSSELVMCSIAITMVHSTLVITGQSATINRTDCLLVNYLLCKSTFVLSGKSNSLQSKKVTLKSNESKSKSTA